MLMDGDRWMVLIDTPTWLSAERRYSIGQVSARYQPSIGRLWTAYRPTSSRLLSDTWFSQHSTDYRLLLVECRSCFDRHVDLAKTDMLITGRSRCQSLSSIDTRSRVSLVMQVSLVMIPLNSYFAFLQNNRKNGGHKTCFLIISS